VAFGELVECLCAVNGEQINTLLALLVHSLSHPSSHGSVITHKVPVVLMFCFKYSKMVYLQSCHLLLNPRAFVQSSSTGWCYLSPSLNGKVKEWLSGTPPCCSALQGLTSTRLLPLVYGVPQLFLEGYCNGSLMSLPSGCGFPRKPGGTEAVLNMPSIFELAKYLPSTCGYKKFMEK